MKKKFVLSLWSYCLITFGVLLVFSSHVFASSTFTSHSFGGKTYKLFVPSTYDPATETSLMVMLHGCTQDANQFSVGTEMNIVAEEKGFIVLYPEQSSSANSSKCWNWFEPAHQSRGSGEPAVIAGMVQQVKNNYSIDQSQVYVAGLSAGGAMSVIMGATYPDVFSGVGVGAGLEYKAATSSLQAWTAMSNGGPDPIRQGRLAYQAMGQYAQVIPTMVFHGDSDFTVQSINGHQVITQWAKTNDLAYDGQENTYFYDVADEVIQGQVSGGRSYTRSIYRDNAGNLLMEKYIVDGMGHAWSGGSSQGSYTDPAGPRASELMWEFFNSSEHKDPEDEPGENIPLVTSAEPSGGTYTAPVQVTLHTNREATTYYTLDESQPDEHSQVYTGPIQIEQSTTLKFYSVDTNGLVEEIQTESYIIDEGSSEHVTLTSITQEDGFVGRFSADGLGINVLKVGDKGMFNTDTYRTILSFNTSSLNSNDIIKGAVVRLYRKSLTGNIRSLEIDLKSGYFGSSPTLEQTDYAATATITNFMTVQVPSNDQEYIDIEIPSNYLDHINKNDRTQFRIKANTTASFTSNLLEIYGSSSQDFAPQLILSLE
ncbi:extracellular catalytic domain type 1 short-chain-length polyhydroxyalkanoate depolymerase [Alkalihalobacterium chitinilyticum]|uniref:PHB depolymerase family esterase n=1 Tax=Alkalihalobacterium chitinilyticum TaxID=2980103 RepID=A0ABT5VAP2_9BACI|nr:PHB depolymerase family esterase [Alkalihalobacterium chitinilyticum]MDE5412537.1 PHB depolymerase family esterase [Alkalihalobacterium chitinilyticum]